MLAEMLKRLVDVFFEVLGKLPFVVEALEQVEPLVEELLRYREALELQVLDNVDEVGGKRGEESNA